MARDGYEHDEAGDEPPGGDAAALHGLASASIAQMPGYDKLVSDQADVLHELLNGDGIEGNPEGTPPISGRHAYYEWVLHVLAVGLGRRSPLASILLNERLIPFLVASERGASPAGRVARQRVARRVLEEYAAPAQDRFAKKAKEQPFVEVKHLRESKQGSDWDRVAGEQ